MLRERGGENIDLRQSPAEAVEEEAPVLADQLVLQNSNHLPAEFAQRAIHFALTRLVAGKLHAPELRVLPRLRDAERAAAPKAAVDEDGEFEFREGEVGFALHRRRQPVRRWILKMPISRSRVSLARDITSERLALV